MTTPKLLIGLTLFAAPALIPPAFAITVKMDFNNDGRADLAIGAPSADVAGKFDAGSVTVLYGSNRAGNLSADNGQVLTVEAPYIPGSADHGDMFGDALAAGDFNGDGYTDLAVGMSRRGALHKQGV